MLMSVYVDGFNLYYRMLKARPDLKWLNPFLLAQNILNTSHQIIRLNYYIARISARVHDPDAPARQAVPSRLEPMCIVHEAMGAS